MKILLTADPEIQVPPELYGGIERVIDQLAQGYADLGHKVVLVANSMSRCKHIQKLYAWPGKSSISNRDTLVNMMMLRNVVSVEKPNLIHSFSRLAYLTGLLLDKTVIIQSYQRKISSRTTNWAKFAFGKRLILTACGAHMIAQLKNPQNWKIVPNCCDTSYLTPIPTPTGEYLAFLGRIEPIKGVLEAIEFANSTNQKLILAGNIEPEWRSFFADHVAIHIDNERVKYLGPVNDDEKRKLLSNAKAFLMLIRWEEPFGIVMAEALSCGVPIIALNRGSVSEIVRHGFNGIVGDSLDQLAKDFSLIESIKRQDCRKDALTRFSIASVAKKYLDVIT